MKKLLTILAIIISCASYSATYYSLGDGAWDDGNLWSLTSGGAAVGGTLIANDNHTYYIENGDSLDFAGYNPDGTWSDNVIFVDDGVLGSSADFDNSNVRVLISGNSKIDVTTNFNSFYIYYLTQNPLTEVSDIIVGGDFSTTSIFSNNSNRVGTITADNVSVTNYNYYNTSYQYSDLETTFNITDPATGSINITNFYGNGTFSTNGDVTVSNYYGDVAYSPTLLIGGDFDINDAAADLYGEITISGELLLPNSYTYNLYASLRANLTYDHTGDSQTKLINVKDGGYLGLKGAENTMGINNGNFSANGIQIEEGGHVELDSINLLLTGYSTYSIDGILSIVDGHITQTSNSVVISSTGSVLLKDSDEPATIAAIDEGYWFSSGGGIVNNNYGLLMVEKISVSAGGGVTFNNYEVLFLKSYETDASGNNNIVNANDIIDNPEYEKEHVSPPPANYTGSYLYYCTDEGDVSNIDNSAGGTAFVVPGSAMDDSDPATDDVVAEIFGNVSECMDDFYNRISVALPVDLLYFHAESNDDVVRLDWSTASELNNDNYTIYKSADGVNFYSIGKIDGSGSSTIKNYYSFIDREPKLGVNYYKLVQTDYDGTSKAFPIRSVLYSKEVSVSIFPTVIDSGDFISIQTDKDAEYSIELTNMEGVVVAKAISSGSFDSYFLIPDGVKTGIYFLKVVMPQMEYIEHILVK